MERLIYSNSIPCKPNPNSAFLPRHRKPSTASFPLLPRLGLRRSGTFSCALNDPSSLPAKADTFPEKRLSFYEDSGNGSKPNPTRYLDWVSQKLSRQQKFTKAGIVILISTLFLTFLHPSTISPAFATLQSAAKTTAPSVGNSLIRSELLSSAWTGFFAGCLHTLSGPDHLAALAPLSIGRTKMESAAVGALWGCGHDAGQLLFGLLFLLLKDRLHIEVIRTWGTRVVGFTLLVIGAMGIKEATEASGDVTDVAEYDKTLTVGKKKIGFATFATGIVHGLQPDALLIILPALALPSRVAGAAFLVMFLLGTVMAMGSYTVFIGSCSEALKERVPRITEKLTWASSLIAIGLGFALLVSQYFGFSLY